MRSRSVRIPRQTIAALGLTVAAVASARGELPAEWSEMLAPRARMSPAATERWGYHATTWQPWNAGDLDANGGVVRPGFAPDDFRTQGPPGGGPAGRLFPPAPPPGPYGPYGPVGAVNSPSVEMAATAPRSFAPPPPATVPLESRSQWPARSTAEPARRELPSAAPIRRPTIPIAVNRGPATAPAEPQTDRSGPLLQIPAPPPDSAIATSDEIPFASSSTPEHRLPALPAPRAVNEVAAAIEPYRRSVESLQDDSLVAEAHPVVVPASTDRPNWLAHGPDLGPPDASATVVHAAEVAPDAPQSPRLERRQFGEVFRGSRRVEPPARTPTRTAPRPLTSAQTDPLAWPPRSAADDQPFYLP